MGRRSLYGRGQQCQHCGKKITKGYSCDECKARIKSECNQREKEAYRNKRLRLQRGIDPVKEKLIDKELAVGELRPWLECSVEVGQHGPCRSLKGTPEFAQLAAQYQGRQTTKQPAIAPYAATVGR